MGTFFYYGVAFLIGAFPVQKYAQRIAERHQLLKVTTKNKTSQIYFTLDPWAELFLGIFDFLKAFILTAAAGALFGSTMAMILTALFTVLGQVYSPFKKAKTNSGISAMLGAAAAMDFKILLIAILAYALILIFVNYLKISLVLTNALMPLLVYFVTGNIYIVIFSLLCLLLNIIIYWPNINNYYAGRETDLKTAFQRRNK